MRLRLTGPSGPDAAILALHDALEEFAQIAPLQAKVVELRYFGGLTVEETVAVTEDCHHHYARLGFREKLGWLPGVEPANQSLPQLILRKNKTTDHRFKHPPRRSIIDFLHSL